MAFSFTLAKSPAVAGAGPTIYTATTDTSSAAGTINPGFTPTRVVVYDRTNVTRYEWNAGMANDSMYKTVTAGTYTRVTSNAITPVLASSGSTAGVTLGTGIHTNSSTYEIELWP